MSTDEERQMKINFRDIPKTTALYTDYIYDFEKLRDFYSLAPYDEKDYDALLEKLASSRYEREKTIQVLKEQNNSFGNHETTIQSIDKLKGENCFAVVTGQQAGLFGGPLYTVYKAMTAINMARYLTFTKPYTFLPIFWVEGEDHDFEEIRKTYFIDKDSQAAELRYEPEIPHAGQCVGKMVLDENISKLIDKYGHSIHDTDFKAELIAALRKCYYPGNTLARAFAQWLSSLLGPYGLIILDPSDERIKKITIPVYKTSLEKHEKQISPALENASRQLLSRGYHAQVSHRTDTLDFFYHEPRRLPLIKENGRFKLKDTGRTFAEKDLMKIIEDEPANFSPNVALRPQVQDYLLPTAVYVAGPSEVAYFAQYKETYKIFGTPMPVIYPRKSLTVIEAKINKIMRKYEIETTEIFGDRRSLERRILASHTPSGLRSAIEAARKNLSDDMDAVEKEASALDPNIKPLVLTAKGKIEKEIARLETRITSEIENKEKIIQGQVDKVFTSLFPDNRLQERHFNILTFLHKYHHRFLYSLMEMTCCRHEGNHLIWKVDLL